VWNDAEHIPQSYRLVEGTALDFRLGAALGERLNQPEPQIVNARGLNNLYLLDRPDGSGPAARLTHPSSGRAVSLYTDLPAVMLYTGGYLDHTIALEEDGFASPGCALALEPQLLPITPNMREASVVTTPERPYDHWIAYAFGIEP
jgi:aldose 1-epimerase